jgi:hypothetical protein
MQKIYFYSVDTSMTGLAKFRFNNLLRKITKHNLMWLYMSYGSATQVSRCHLWLCRNIFCYAAHALFKGKWHARFISIAYEKSDFRGRVIQSPIPWGLRIIIYCLITHAITNRWRI